MITIKRMYKYEDLEVDYQFDTYEAAAMSVLNNYGAYNRNVVASFAAKLKQHTNTGRKLPHNRRAYDIFVMDENYNG